MLFLNEIGAGGRGMERGKRVWGGAEVVGPKGARGTLQATLETFPVTPQRKNKPTSSPALAQPAVSTSLASGPLLNCLPTSHPELFKQRKTQGLSAPKRQ